MKYAIFFLTGLLALLTSDISAQPVIYNDSETLITGTWNAPNGGGESAELLEITGENPHEGQLHYRFEYNFLNFWAGFGLNLDNWSAGPTRDFSGYTHLRLAFRGLSPGQTLKVFLRNGNDNGNTLTVGGPSANYTVVDLSMIALTLGSPVSPQAVSEINFFIDPLGVQTGSGTVYLDAIELVNLSGGNGQPASPATMARAATLGAGVNTANWLEAYWLIPFSAYPEVDRYNRERVQALRDAGFTTFRLPVTFERLGDVNPPYDLDFSNIAFSLVDSMISWANEMDFRLIIDNHHGYPLTNANYQTELPRLQAVWTQLIDRYDYLDPERFFFELYNEPQNGISNENWRSVASSLLSTVRALETQTHSVLIGAADWNSGQALLTFTPLNDADVIYTFHYYDPYLFTHQGMSWTSPPNLPSRSFPLGNELQELSDLMQAVYEWGQLYEVPVNLGEFGCATSADAVSRCNWISAVMGEVVTQGFSHCYWDAISPSDAFGFFDNGIVSQATGIPCFVEAIGLYPLPLSVEQGAFQVECRSGKAQLVWQVYEAQSGTRMEVQRSVDGRAWQTLYQTELKPHQSDYHFTDVNPEPNSLYRLRQRSPQGEVTLSPMRIAACTEDVPVQVFPNPSRDLLHIQTELGASLRQWTLYHANGEVGRSQHYHESEKVWQTIASVAGLPSGLYLLRLQWYSMPDRFVPVVVE